MNTNTHTRLRDETQYSTNNFHSQLNFTNQSLQKNQENEILKRIKNGNYVPKGIEKNVTKKRRPYLPISIPKGH